MKKCDIEKITTNILAEKLNEGFTLEWNDTSYGAGTVHWLSNRESGERLLLCAMEEQTEYDENYVRLRCWNVYIVPVSKHEQWVKSSIENAEPVRSFYKVAEDWFIESYEEAYEAKRRYIERYRNNCLPSSNESIAVTEKAVEMFAKVFGDDRIKAKHLSIHAGWSYSRTLDRKVRSYTVNLYNRVGNPKDFRTYRFA